MERSFPFGVVSIQGSIKTRVVNKLLYDCRDDDFKCIYFCTSLLVERPRFLPANTTFIDDVAALDAEWQAYRSRYCRAFCKGEQEALKLLVLLQCHYDDYNATITSVLELFTSAMHFRVCLVVLSDFKPAYQGGQMSVVYLPCVASGNNAHSLSWLTPWSNKTIHEFLINAHEQCNKSIDPMVIRLPVVNGKDVDLVTLRGWKCLDKPSYYSLSLVLAKDPLWSRLYRDLKQLLKSYLVIITY